MSKPNSTALVGPYDHLLTTERATITCTIDPGAKSRLFTNFCPFRGATDKVLSRFVHMLDTYVNEHFSTIELSPEHREVVLHNILNSLVDHFNSLSPEEQLKLPNTTDVE